VARDYKKEYREYHSKPEQIRNRAKRNAARREMEEEGRVHKGDGKDVDHKRALINGGSNADSNLRVVSRSVNRGFRRDSRGRPL
jgi:hypothetical protein